MKIGFSGNRRTFLGTMAVCGGFTSLLALIKPTTVAAGNPIPRPSRSGQGYRLTEHIKKYYETARM